MKKLLPLLGVLAFVAILIMSCDSSLPSDELGLENQVWKITAMGSTGGVISTITLPIVDIDDFDSDGTDETLTSNGYMYLSGGIFYSYEVSTLIDGGTDTTSLADWAGTSKDTMTYNIAGSTITLDGEVGDYSLSGTTLTLTSSIQVDTYDEDNDGNTTEVYRNFYTLIKVTSPTFAELEAASL